jgi:DNA-binding PadR family transcriptional regulator
MDEIRPLILEALRVGTAQGGEVRLYRAGKLPGLFAARTSRHAEAAGAAVRDGLIEIVRTETKGKTVVEWARVTPKGTGYFVEHESPARALAELRELLHVNGAGVPGWVAELRDRLDAVSRQFLAEVEGVRQRLDQVSGRVTTAIERLEQRHAPAAHLPDWSAAALEYLGQRRHVVETVKCPLAELFAALRLRGAELSLKDFHLGLRRLHEDGAIKLETHDVDGAPPEPEYALLDGGTVYYYVVAGKRLTPGAGR